MISPTKEIEVDGRTFTVRQLTLQEVCLYLEFPLKAPQELQVVNALLLEQERMSVMDVLAMTDISVADLKGLTEHCVMQLASAAREVSPRFFLMRERLAELGQQALAETGPPTA
jgi:hypothetical protein